MEQGEWDTCISHSFFLLCPQGKEWGSLAAKLHQQPGMGDSSLRLPMWDAPKTPDVGKSVSRMLLEFSWQPWNVGFIASASCWTFLRGGKSEAIPKEFLSFWDFSLFSVTKITGFKTICSECSTWFVATESPLLSQKSYLWNTSIWTQMRAEPYDRGVWYHYSKRSLLRKALWNHGGY